MKTIINKFLKAQKKYEEAGLELKTAFYDLIEDDLEKAQSLEDCTAIKEKLRPMPESVGKVLLFRAIILKEDKIIQDNLNKF